VKTVRGGTPVFIYAADPLSAAGAKAQLFNEPSIELVGPADLGRARVALVVAEAVDETLARVVRTVRRDGIANVVVVAARFEENGVVAAVAAGVTNFLRRADATSARLVDVIRRADRDGCTLPDALLRRAAGVGDESDGPRPREAIDVAAGGGLTTLDLTSGSPGARVEGGRTAVLTAPVARATAFAATEPVRLGGGLRLSAREVEVLRRVADGYDTTDVAEQLAYSESTIKGVLAKIMARLEARNRCHAVAIALREGLL
jgi:DNA-binding NarL/FixJ family response regulator